METGNDRITNQNLFFLIKWRLPKKVVFEEKIYTTKCLKKSKLLTKIAYLRSLPEK